MAEAATYSTGEHIDWTPTAAVVAGEILHLPDGRAAWAPTAIAAGVAGSVQVSGIVRLAKTATMVMLKGTKIYWDHSASAASILFGANTADYFVGTAIVTAASADTTVDVNLNVEPQYTLALRDGFTAVPIPAITANPAGMMFAHGNGVSMVFDTAAEAEKFDALSTRGVAVSTPGIVSALVNIVQNGDDAAFDFNVGLANASHATDADLITESLFAHIDGASLNIMAESDDGTTEVAATDTTVDAVVGTPFLVQWDLTVNSDIQMYINGVAVLTASVFDLSLATGPLKLLVHMEKTANNSPGSVTVMDLGFTAFDV